MGYVMVCVGPAMVVVGMAMCVENRQNEEREGAGGVERQFVVWLEDNGMNDPHGYFTRQLATMAEDHQVHHIGLIHSAQCLYWDNVYVLTRYG